MRKIRQIFRSNSTPATTELKNLQHQETDNKKRKKVKLSFMKQMSIFEVLFYTRNEDVIFALTWTI